MHRFRHRERLARGAQRCGSDPAVFDYVRMLHGSLGLPGCCWQHSAFALRRHWWLTGPVCDAEAQGGQQLVGTSADKTDWADCLAELAETLTHRGWRLVTAESCTGGWIAKCCTDRPGSSTWYEGGAVSYSNALKTSLLGVRPATLARDGAVSEATAREMAQGALARLGGEVAVAVTGIAGPGGGSPDKPVGMVWFAWAGPGLRLDSRCMHFPGDREAVRAATVGAALTGLRDFLRVTPPGGAWT